MFSNISTADRLMTESVCVKINLVGKDEWRGGKCIHEHLFAVTLECWLVHGGHSGTVVLPWEPLDVDLQRNGPHRGAEVEQTHLWNHDQSVIFVLQQNAAQGTP